MIAWSWKPELLITMLQSYKTRALLLVCEVAHGVDAAIGAWSPRF